MLLDPRWEKKIDEVPAVEEPWRKVLRDAADLLTKGWTQRAYHRSIYDPLNDSSGDLYCAVGAINVIGGSKPEDYRSLGHHRQAHEKLLAFIGRPQWGSVQAWNDATQAATVIKAMRDCAEAP